MIKRVHLRSPACCVINLQSSLSQISALRFVVHYWREDALQERRSFQAGEKTRHLQREAGVDFWTAKQALICLHKTPLLSHILLQIKSTPHSMFFMQADSLCGFFPPNIWCVKSIWIFLWHFIYFFFKTAPPRRTLKFILEKEDRCVCGGGGSDVRRLRGWVRRGRSAAGWVGEEGQLAGFVYG